MKFWFSFGGHVWAFNGAMLGLLSHLGRNAVDPTLGYVVAATCFGVAIYLWRQGR